jgi:predicted dehydrogenase
MRAIVTGSGSIAKRHILNLRALFPDIRIDLVVRPGHRSLDGEVLQIIGHTYMDIETAAANTADLAIIASPAHLHVAQALVLAARRIPMLVEKPLSISLRDCALLQETCAARMVPVVVGYCLRYHPLFLLLATQVKEGKIGAVLSLRAEVGQYLPDWRLDRDYRSSVTANAALGGGALLELSHEIDLVRALLGLPRSLEAIVTRVSRLETDSDDVVEIIQLHNNVGCPAVSSIHLDLFQRPARRFLSIVGENGRIELDFLAGTLMVFDVVGNRHIEKLPPGFSSNDLYLAEVSELLECVTKNSQPTVSLADGMATLSVIEAARHAVTRSRATAWRKND